MPVVRLVPGELARADDPVGAAAGARPAPGSRSATAGRATPVASAGCGQPDVAALAGHSGSNPLFLCPLYQTSERRGAMGSAGRASHLVLTALLPADAPPDVWTLRGTAMLLCTDD